MIIGYTRVSQADGESLKVQRRQLHGYALQHGLYISKIYVEEGVSGSIPLGERPEGATLLKSLKQGDMVVVPKLDRMFRSALDALETLERLQKLQVDLIALDMGGSVLRDGMSKFLFSMLAAVAEWERTRVRDRIREAKKQQKQRGDYLGGPAPLGWRVIDRKYVPDPEGQQVIADIFALRAVGQSYAKIAEILRQRGLRISHQTVKHVLDGKIRRANPTEPTEGD